MYFCENRIMIVYAFPVIYICYRCYCFAVVLRLLFLIYPVLLKSNWVRKHGIYVWDKNCKKSEMWTQRYNMHKHVYWFNWIFKYVPKQSLSFWEHKCIWWHLTNKFACFGTQIYEALFIKDHGNVLFFFFIFLTILSTYLVMKH